jgi:hypothetical protein
MISLPNYQEATAVYFPPPLPLLPIAGPLCSTNPRSTFPASRHQTALYNVASRFSPAFEGYYPCGAQIKSSLTERWSIGCGSVFFILTPAKSPPARAKSFNGQCLLEPAQCPDDAGTYVYSYRRAISVLMHVVYGEMVEMEHAMCHSVMAAHKTNITTYSIPQFLHQVLQIP